MTASNVHTPVYTRPREFRGWKVPEILLAGKEKLIDKWNYNHAVERTNKRRPDFTDKV
ncbi:MAG: hypothetical protein H8E34_14120 [Bacteroidetes bacterium]|nr:hypothetical protein [Bacteroidota bacterium]